MHRSRPHTKAVPLVAKFSCHHEGERHHLTVLFVGGYYANPAIPVPAFPILKDIRERRMRIPQAENVGARIGIMIPDS